MLHGTAKTETNFERVVLDEGVYDAKLIKAIVLKGKPTQYQPEGAPKIMLVWEVGEGDDAVEVVDYLGFPKNLAYNEKSKFWKKLGEIVGEKISSENAARWGISFGELDNFIQSYEDLVEHINTPTDNGKTEKAEVVRMTWGPNDVLGVRRQLVLKIWESDNGNTGNDITAIMGAKKGAKPKPKPAAAEHALPQAQGQLAAPSNPNDMPF